MGEYEKICIKYANIRVFSENLQVNTKSSTLESRFQLRENVELTQSLAYLSIINQSYFISLCILGMVMSFFDNISRVNAEHYLQLSVSHVL